MLDVFIPAIDAVGTMAFLAAFQYAWKTIPCAGESRSYWVIFAFAMLLGFAFAISTTLAELGLGTAVFTEWKPILLVIVTIDLSLAAILSYISLARPFD